MNHYPVSRHSSILCGMLARVPVAIGSTQRVLMLSGLHRRQALRIHRWRLLVSRIRINQRRGMTPMTAPSAVQCLLHERLRKQFGSFAESPTGFPALLSQKRTCDRQRSLACRTVVLRLSRRFATSFTGVPKTAPKTSDISFRNHGVILNGSSCAQTTAQSKSDTPMNQVPER